MLKISTPPFDIFIKLSKKRVIVGEKIMQLHQGHGKERDGMVCETEAERALCQARCIPGTEPEFCSSVRIWVLVSQPGSVSSCLQSDFSGFVLRALG